jgi:diacylglycerol kinase (ATP)
VEIDFDSYDALIIVGGDGTTNEVITGMLRREDKKRLPIGVIPNGSGNDLCHSLKHDSVKKALEYLVKGDLINLDIAKVLIDADSESEIPHEVKEARIKYMASSTVFSVASKINMTAQKFKKVFGGTAYNIGAMFHIIMMQSDVFNIEVDGKCVLDSEPATLISVHNNKNCGGGIYISPFSVMNDGELELVISKCSERREVIDILNKGQKEGGIHCYNEKMHSFHRGKELKFRPIKGRFGKSKWFSVDGEDFCMADFVKIECMPGEI